MAPSRGEGARRPFEGQGEREKKGEKRGRLSDVETDLSGVPSCMDEMRCYWLQELCSSFPLLDDGNISE